MSEGRSEAKRWFLTVNGAVLEALGGLTAYFAHLEEEVSHFIWSLIAGYDVLGPAPSAEQSRNSFQSQKLGQAVTLKLSFRQKLEVLGALAFERFSGAPELLQDIQAMQAELEAAATERNRLIHSVLAGLNQPDGGVVPGVAIAIKTTRDKDLGMTQAVSVHSQEQLAAAADSLAGLAYRLHELRQRSFPPHEPPE